MQKCRVDGPLRHECQSRSVNRGRDQVQDCYTNRSGWVGGLLPAALALAAAFLHGWSRHWLSRRVGRLLGFVLGPL